MPGRAAVDGPLFNTKSSDDEASLDDLFLCDSHSSNRLSVRKSQIPGAGCGLVSMSRIGEGEEILHKDQLCFVSDNHLPVTCNNCVQWVVRSIDASGRMRGIGGSDLKVKPCAGCLLSRCEQEVGGGYFIE